MADLPEAKVADLPSVLRDPNLACNQQPDLFKPIQSTEYSVVRWMDRRSAAAELCAQCRLLDECMDDALGRHIPYAHEYVKRKNRQSQSERPEFAPDLSEHQLPLIRAGLTQIERERAMEHAVAFKKATFPKHVDSVIQGAAKRAMFNARVISSLD